MLLEHSTAQECLNKLVMNLDYQLRVKNVKKIIVCSDVKGEGKSTFIESCTPLMADIYKRKIAVVDFVGDIEVENKLVTVVNMQELAHLSSDTKKRKIQINGYVSELAKSFDSLFINIEILKRAEKTELPAIEIDGAILVRSSKGQKSTKKITEELEDRNIQIVGIVENGGL